MTRKTNDLRFWSRAAAVKVFQGIVLEVAYILGATKDKS